MDHIDAKALSLKSALLEIEIIEAAIRKCADNSLTEAKLFKQPSQAAQRYFTDAGFTYNERGHGWSRCYFFTW